MALKKIEGSFPDKPYNRVASAYSVPTFLPPVFDNTNDIIIGNLDLCKGTSRLEISYEPDEYISQRVGFFRWAKVRKPQITKLDLLTPWRQDRCALMTLRFRDWEIHFFATKYLKINNPVKVLHGYEKPDYNLFPETEVNLETILTAWEAMLDTIKPR